MHEPRELHGSSTGLHWYRKVFLASLSSHLAAAAQPLVSPDSEVSAVTTTVHPNYEHI